MTYLIPFICLFGCVLCGAIGWRFGRAQSRDDVDGLRLDAHYLRQRFDSVSRRLEKSQARAHRERMARMFGE